MKKPTKPKNNCDFCTFNEAIVTDYRNFGYEGTEFGACIVCGNLNDYTVLELMHAHNAEEIADVMEGILDDSWGKAIDALDYDRTDTDSIITAWQKLGKHENEEFRKRIKSKA